MYILFSSSFRQLSKKNDQDTVPVTGNIIDTGYQESREGSCQGLYCIDGGKPRNEYLSWLINHLDKNSTRRAERTRMRYETLIHPEV